MVTKTSLDGESRELRKIIKKEYDNSKKPVMVTLTLSCGCKVVRPSYRVPHGTNMYCLECRNKNG